jgi:hypothetical protein
MAKRLNRARAVIALLIKLIASLHDAIFLRYKKWHFNANTFNNAKNHIKDVHYFNKGGNI